MLTKINWQSQDAQAGTRYLVQLQGGHCRAGAIVRGSLDVVRKWFDSFASMQVRDAEWIVEWNGGFLAGLLPFPEFKIMLTVDFNGPGAMPFPVLFQAVHDPCDPLLASKKTGTWELEKVWRVNASETRVNDIVRSSPEVPTSVRVGAAVDQAEEAVRNQAREAGDAVGDVVDKARVPLALVAVIVAGLVFLSIK